jgi:HPr kinase/phosphorylase
MVISIEEWVEGKEYDRMGLDEKTHSLLEVPLPHRTLPVRPGRSLSVIIEVAAMNQRLKKTGVNTARAFNDKLLEWMQKGAAEAARPKPRSPRRRAAKD